jgi:glycogen debranching enzyme
MKSIARRKQGIVSAAGRNRADAMNEDQNSNHHFSPEDPFYILASASLADERARVLKHGNTFAVFDHFGDIVPAGLCEQGLYHDGTRFLSCFVLELGRDRPLFLSSTIKEQNDLLTVDLTNPDIAGSDDVVVPRGTLHIFRSKFLWAGASYERLEIRNYGLDPVQVAFTLYFKADFVDIFEVRGTRRARRGESLPAEIESGSATLAYRGLDGVVRRSRIIIDPEPQALTSSEARFRFLLPPAQEKTIHVTVACETDGPANLLMFDHALSKSAHGLQHAPVKSCTVQGSKQYFNDWINRTVADLHMMTTETPAGPYPYAGVPWFSTPFGRDGIITAFECLWMNPSLARGVLCYLADCQAKAVNAEQDAEPGKILHETRSGEMATLGEIPFGRYYGSVDSTPLFVMLAGAYYQRTADQAFIESLWPNLEAALHWIDAYGDIDGDGFVEYSRRSPKGLGNQGWKDSHDAVFHADGRMAEGPIALCEVQGYVYAAKCAAAELAMVLGKSKRADELRQQASALWARFDDAFWCEDLDTYAIALDGAKHPCRVRTSNAGHCLMTGIVTPERARRVAQTLLGPDFFSGWGVRTVAATEARFNPMSYHNGSVWPHDNALIAYGLARYGLKQEVLQILNGLSDASHYIDLHRLPELFCGFARRAGEGPTLYPVACAPQAWAAAAVFLLLQACLGLNIQAAESRLSFSYPVLPAFLDEVRIRNLQVGQAVVDLLLLRHDGDVGINVLRREGKIQITMVK